MAALSRYLPSVKHVKTQSLFAGARGNLQKEAPSFIYSNIRRYPCGCEVQGGNTPAEEAAGKE